MNIQKVNQVMVGEALVGEGNEVTHVDLIIGLEVVAQKLRFALR